MPFGIDNTEFYKESPEHVFKTFLFSKISSSKEQCTLFLYIYDLVPSMNFLSIQKITQMEQCNKFW